MKKKIIASSLAFAFAAGASGQVMAADDDGIQSILVTAQQRKQSERDVPIAMQVVAMKDIEALGASNLADMNGYIPGLSVGGGDETQPSFGLRGISPSDFGVATDSPVGVYVDGVFAGKSGGSLLNFNDVQRIEVLKGPQGTLFGRNSAAGAISIVTNEPAPDFDASGSVRFGSNHSTNINGMVNAPINDTTAMRLSFVSDKSDGWKKNSADGDHSLGGSDAIGIRASLKWAPSAQTKTIVTYEHSKLDQKARAAFGVAPANDFGALGAAIPKAPGVFSEFTDPIDSPLFNDAPSKETMDFDALSLRIETPLAGMIFNSTTSFRKFDSYNLGDYDGTANVATRLDTLNVEKNTTWQQEFKLSAKNDRYDWIAGASFFHSRASQTSGATLSVDSLDTLDFRTNALFPLHGGAATGAFFTAGVLDSLCGGCGAGSSGTLWSETVNNDVKSRSLALYGDVIWHLSPATNLTAGLRWSKDKKDVSWFVPSATTSDGDLTAMVLAGAGAPNLLFSTAATAAASKIWASNSWTDVSPRVVIDHKLDKDTMLYASVAKGYQSGGYSVMNPLGGFDPEVMKNVEAGFKAAFPAQRAVLSGSLFAYEFTNLQSIELRSGSAAVPIYDVTTGDQKAIGLDLDGSIKLSSNVKLFGATEYIRQTWKRKIDSSGIDISGDSTGFPKWTMMAGINVTWASLGGHADFTLQGTHKTKSGCASTPVADDYSCSSGGQFSPRAAQSKVDMRLGWINADRRYGVAVIVNNLLDKQYVGAPGGTAKDIGAYQSDVSDPRFVGIEFKASL